MQGESAYSLSHLKGCEEGAGVYLGILSFFLDCLFSRQLKSLNGKTVRPFAKSSRTCVRAYFDNHEIDCIILCCFSQSHY